MLVFLRAFSALLLSLTIALAACGSGSEGDTGTTSPSPTVVEEAPPPPTPAVESGAQVVAEGTLSSTIAPGGIARFDPLTLPLNPGAEVPSCESYVFSFGWLVIDPYPAEDVDLRWQWAKEDGAEEVGTGASGVATIGCGFLEAMNRTGSKITVEAHYVIASTSP